MQEVFSNTSKVLVTGNKGGQNNLLYLPLDKMIDSGRGGNAPVTGAASAASNEVNARAAADLQQQQTRSRESR
jgi:membrane protease subunit HflK